MSFGVVLILPLHCEAAVSALRHVGGPRLATLDPRSGAMASLQQLSGRRIADVLRESWHTYYKEA